MKSWEYYSTPIKHPWVTGTEITKFKNGLSDSYTENTKKYITTNFIWGSDDKTRNELLSLEHEFMLDTCSDLGITKERYLELDPYDQIIGCPENHEFPAASEFKKMYEYVKEKTRT